MPLSRSRKVLITTATAVGLLGGSAAVAAAASGGSGASDGNNPAYTSSVTAPDNENQQGLASLATITGAQARHAAEAATGGTARTAELENENGSVVYGVAVTLPDGRKLDLKVDAGNGKVLAREADQQGSESSGREEHGTAGTEQHGAENTTSTEANG